MEAQWFKERWNFFANKPEALYFFLVSKFIGTQNFFLIFFSFFAKPQPITLFAQNVSLKIYIIMYIILDIGVDGPETDFMIRKYWKVVIKW